MFQMCNLANSFGNILDLVHTNMPELAVVQKTDMLLIPYELSHTAHVQMTSIAEYQPYVFPSSKSSRQIYCFRKADFGPIIYRALTSMNYLKTVI